MPTLNEKFEAWWSDWWATNEFPVGAQAVTGRDPQFNAGLRSGAKCGFLAGAKAERDAIFAEVEDVHERGLEVGWLTQRSLEAVCYEIERRIKERDNG